MSSLVLNQLIVEIHQILEVLDGLHLELQRSILVTDKDGARVLLKRRHSPHVVDALFNGHVKGIGLVRTGNQNHHLRTHKHVTASDQQSITSTLCMPKTNYEDRTPKYFQIAIFLYVQSSLFSRDTTPLAMFIVGAI